MLIPNDFLEKWDANKRPLIKFDRALLDQFQLPEDAKTLLDEVGLPKSAAPYLSFSVSDSEYMQWLYSEGFTPGHFPIGETAYGDIISICGESGEIIIVDHEDTTRKTFMNSSLRQLLECLLEHADFITIVRNTFGSNAYIESDYPPYILENHAKRQMHTSLCNGLIKHTYSSLLCSAFETSQQSDIRLYYIHQRVYLRACSSGPCVLRIVCAGMLVFPPLPEIATPFQAISRQKRALSGRIRFERRVNHEDHQNDFAAGAHRGPAGFAAGGAGRGRRG